MQGEPTAVIAVCVEPADPIILRLEESDIPEFKTEMQKAFQNGYEDVFGRCGETILPESHIDDSLSKTNSAAYKAVLNGETVGGAIVVIDSNARGELDFLFVKVGHQGKGIGQFIWRFIEREYPEVRLWETHTPHFDRRNIHFYINRCGFSAVEFFTKNHPDPHFPEEEENDFGGMFRFEKRMPSDQ